ncbi:hypothetical protein ZIOFF_036432 [Zingiber officinale]|uniref:DUF4283 domain-containing protein n=1 Tax=Zingiber officinale TaxID=94328 RepID=A0A8J5GN01_ZINOF|nr:hypothetical protein ZIOFF_036432 [Zingiber officinale]
MVTKGETSPLLSKVPYAEALKLASPRVTKKSFNEVGEDYKRATTYNNKPAIFYTEEEFSGMSNAFLFVSEIWLPDLPIHMFYKKGLFAPVNIVGRPLKVDESTTDGSRLTMARVCVEIDLVKPEIEDFWIGIGDDRRLEKVIYERQPKYCLHCQHLGNSVEECYDSRDLKEDKYLKGIPKEGVEAHPGDSEGFSVENSFHILENLEENVLDLHNLDIRDREEELVVNQKMVHEEVWVHVSYGTKAYREKGVAVVEISKKTSFFGRRGGCRGFNISKSFVEMEDLDLDNLVIKKGSSSLNDESSGGAVRQGPDWDPGIHNMMTRCKTQMVLT